MSLTRQLTIKKYTDVRNRVAILVNIDILNCEPRDDFTTAGSMASLPEKAETNKTVK